MRRGIMGACALLVSGCLERHPDYGESSGGGGNGNDAGSGSGTDAGGSEPDTSDGGTSGSGGVGGTGSSDASSTGATGDGGSTDGGGSGSGTGGTGGSSTTETATGGSGSTGGDTTSPPPTTGGSSSPTTGGATTTTVMTTSAGGSTTTTGGMTTGGATTTTGGATGCSHLWAEPGWTLETPEHLQGLSSAGFDGDPYLSADGLTLYFASDREGPSGESDVFVATRPDLGSPFGAPTFLDAGVNTTDSEWTFAVAQNGLLAYLNTNRSGGSGNADVWQMTRASTADDWGNAVPRTELNSSGPEWDAFTMPDGLTLYYNVGGSNADNYVATRPSLSDPFDPGVPLLNSPVVDSTPTLTADGLVIVFGSYRSGSLGSQDLWYATRPTTADPWSTPQLLPVVNTSDNEGESHLSYDGCELFYTHGVGGISGWDLYRTRFVAP